MSPNLFTAALRDDDAAFSGRASRPRLLLLIFAAACLLAGCASPRISREPVSASDPEAFSLLTASQRAQGAASFSTIRDLNVKYASKWTGVGARSHAVLTDRKFRREAEEAMDLGSDSIAQLQKGPSGRKFVFRAPGRVTVWYNGQSEDRQEVKAAAALVADASKMFLLGPHYFHRPGVTLQKLGERKVGGHECDEILAVLTPGFGFSDEDRVILSIDKKDQFLRGVRMTLHGLQREKNAEAEVTFSNWAPRAGVLWAVDYDERIRSLFSWRTRHWRLLDLKANRGFLPRQPELAGEALEHPE